VVHVREIMNILVKVSGLVFRAFETITFEPPTGVMIPDAV